MTRVLDYATLDAAARHYASEWMREDRRTPSGKNWIGGQAFVEQEYQRFTFKDEFEYLLDSDGGIKAWLGGKALVEFETMAAEKFAPRDDVVFAELLRKKLAIDPNGNHIEGVVGITEIGRERITDRRPVLVRRPIVRPVIPGETAGEWKIVGYREHVSIQPVYWPIYAGEGEERAAGRIKFEIGAAGPGADPLPLTTEPLALGANVTNISEELCRAALDQITARLEEGSTAAEIRGRVGAQPADPDAAESGVLLFTLPMTDPVAFAAAVDDGDGSCSATAGTITDDTSADAGGTLGYCRFAATGTGADDHLDGNATTDGTGATDWNTLVITAGSTISMTSAVAGMSQGSTAS